MKVLVLLVCFVAFCFARDVSRNYKIRSQVLTIPDPDEVIEDEQMLDIEGRIINGIQATNGQYPWATRMSIRTTSGNYLCSGSLVGAGWVISAYHCITASNVTDVLVSLGAVDRQSALMQEVACDEWWWLEAAEGIQPDIAIFHLVEDVILSPNLRPIRLPSVEWTDFTFEGWSAVISGWGGSNTGTPRFLQYGYYLIRENEMCRFADYNVCAVAHRDDILSTQGGDSGKIDWKSL